MNKNNYFHFFIIILGFSSGLPLLLTSSTLQAWYTEQGISIEIIGSLSLIGLPYLLKFLWAPLFDPQNQILFYNRKNILLFFQFTLACSFFIFSYFDPKNHTFSMIVFALFISLLSASLDTVINALQIETCKTSELSLSSACYVSGYRIAMIISGGISLILAQFIGFSYTYKIMSFCFMPGIIITLFFKEKAKKIKNNQNNKSFFLSFIKPTIEFIKRKNFFLIIIFIMYFKISYSFNLIMTPTFLLREMHFSLDQIGTINKILGLLMTILGVFSGGIVAKCFSIKNSLIFSGLFEAGANLLYACFSLVGKSMIWLCFAVSIESFFSGMESAVFLGFLMGMCEKKFSASQFALLVALSSITRVILGPIAGIILNYCSWSEFYIIIFLLFLPNIFLIKKLWN